ncbi:Signal transduction histidine kinase [Promicromonospora umidemergens]|nr:sensor histidine kinase [Promicromonospora umidemergens]MCP2283278.1 Signal transduction histidine kinase [Promicromonospora umidemergens]
MSTAQTTPHSWGDTGRTPRSRAPALRSMQVGQHVIAAVLTVVGAARAIAMGTPIAPALAAAVAVIVWYAAGITAAPGVRSARAARWWLIGLAVVWVAAVAVSEEFVWVAFLIWLLAGHLLPPWPSVGFSVLVLAVVALAPVVHDGTPSYAGFFGPLIGGVFALGISRGYLELLRDARERERLVASLRQTQDEMAAIQEELALTQRQSGAVAERTRLSRDIHDTVAQGLSSIRLLAHAAADRTSDVDAGRALQQVEGLAGDNLVDVRRIVAALAPSELEDDALAAALRRMLDRLRAETGLTADLRVDDTVPPLPTAAEVALLRTAQSALANVRLHAAADRVVVSLVDADDTVRLDILDDGRGFDVDAWNATAATGGSSYGLHFMRSRLRELGGGLDVESTPGDGTALSAYLPLGPTPKEI